ncbi:pectate lyase family protein [Cellulomonas wangsupingiae]|uniref:Polysaccharide lyase family 1 protein n=1 Tax=Cellulomonas wangsupingiae TaxID=2968085 RepID=A0ABY5K432_9CELL|nr:polysaccharide lyase family 1 protein [Cellulomonas wangsupingiae]UUI63820.1 polysaccharide lyase family 1 protein [Cellulomonas wangsupingiae]
MRDTAATPPRRPGAEQTSSRRAEPVRPSPPRRAAVAVVAVALAAGTAAAATTATASPARADTPATTRDLGQETLAPGDGWASWTGTTRPDGRVVQATGTTGGAAAHAAQVHVVETWTQLRDALGGGPGSTGTTARTVTEPRIVYVRGTLDAFAGPDGARLTCDDFAAQVTVAGTDEPFSMAAYIAHFDPTGPWGRTDPAGPLEDARVAAAALQARQTQQHVGSNVTLVGVGDDARIVGANLRIRDASNVIVRNLTLSDAYDCFPQWDPGDSDAGNWNSAYDNLSVWASTSVWADHLTLDDGEHPPSLLETVYGRPYEVHDGLLDVTHGSDLVTVSWNHFDDHDKTSLVGSSDSRLQDRGQHRVTYHHNLWTDIGQRAPRVRFGDVHVYNNVYEQSRAQGYAYLLGAGVESSVVAEENVFDLAPGVDPASVVTAWKGTMLAERGSLVRDVPVDLVAAFNATSPTPLADEARWVPGDHYAPHVQPAADAAVAVRAGAGATLPSGAPGTSAAPDAPRLSDDNGWDTGLHDGDYTITSTLWWGQNATVVRLYENDVLVEARRVDARSPAAQHTAFTLTGRPDGTYTYVAEALNPWGTSRSAPRTVTVRDAAPGTPRLSTSTAADGTVGVTATLWWGTNASEYVLTADGREVDRRQLSPRSPARQTVTTSTAGWAPGRHTVVATFRNAAGESSSLPLEVVVGP